METKKCWLCGQTHCVDYFDGETCQDCWAILDDATDEIEI